MIKVGQFVVYMDRVYFVLFIEDRKALMQDIYTKDNSWVYMSLLIPFNVQLNDSVKVTTLMGSAICTISEISYDNRGNLKIHSPSFGTITKYTSMYYEDFIEMVDKYDTTTF